jgi:hypothetical protein
MAFAVMRKIRVGADDGLTHPTAMSDRTAIEQHERSHYSDRTEWAI